MKKRTYQRPGSQSAETTTIHHEQTLRGHQLLRREVRANFHKLSENDSEE